MKEAGSQKVILGISVVTIVAVIGFLVYFFRASDPAARGPIPYKKFDYGAHMQDQARQYNRQPAAASGAPQ